MSIKLDDVANSTQKDKDIAQTEGQAKADDAPGLKSNLEEQDVKQNELMSTDQEDFDVATVATPSGSSTQHKAYLNLLIRLRTADRRRIKSGDSRCC